MTQTNTKILLRIGMLFTLLFLGNTTLIANPPQTTYKAQTAKDTHIPDEQFKIMIGYLNKEQLFIEADAWLKLLENDAKASSDIGTE